MPRQKNDGRGRLGGRAKGTPNKSTATIREAVAAQWKRYQESGKLQEDIDSLDPATRVVVMERLAQYVTPKMKAVDIDMAVDASVTTIEDRLRELVPGADD